MAFNYIYRLTIKTYERIKESNQLGRQIGEDIVVTDPITLSFNVVRSPFSGNNQATFDIYNLAPETRKKIFYDYFYQDEIKVVYLEAGYEGGAFNIIYSGHIKFATSKRNGTDVITHIEAITGLFVADSSVSITLTENSTDSEIVDFLMSTVPADKGTQTFKNYKFLRPVALYGNSIRLMKKYTNGRVFQDLDKIFVSDDNEIIGGEVLLITDATGLLGTPERQNTTVTINMMFEPRLQIGHGVEVRSNIEPHFNGQYKVYSIKHSGVFGYGTKGNVKTQVELWVGSQLFGAFNYAK